MPEQDEPRFSKEQIDQLVQAIRHELGERQVQIEERRVRLDEWRTHVEPREQEFREAETARISIALLALRSLFLINGGALIGLPAYAALGAPNTSPSMEGLRIGLALFVAGLGAAAIATILAYVSSDLLSASVANFAQRARHLANAPYVQPPHASSGAPTGTASSTYDPQAEAVNEERAGRRRRRWSGGLALFAVGLAILSVGAFVGGAITALDAFAPCAGVR